MKLWNFYWPTCMYLCIYVHMYINASSFLVLHGMSNVKHSSAAICQLAPFFTSSYISLQWCHFLLALPPPVNELCTREHEARHSKTLADFAVPDNTCPLPPSPNLDLFGCWHCRPGSDGCQMSWNVPAEYTLQHRHHIHALTLSTLALFEFDGEKNNQLQIKWSARQHIYTS